MSGGGGSRKAAQPTYTPAPRQTMQPVPQAEFPVAGYGGVGFTPVPQTYTPGAMPNWMQGPQMDLGGQGYVGNVPWANTMGPNWFQMPGWGQSAATGQALTQEQLQPAPYEPPPMPVQQQQAPAPEPAAASAPSRPAADPLAQMIYRQIRAGDMTRAEGRRALGWSVQQANRRGMPLGSSGFSTAARREWE